MVEQSAVKASASATPAAAPATEPKRTREANGKKDKDDEPPSKKKKPEVATPAAKSAASKVTSHGFIIAISIICVLGHSSQCCGESA